MGYLTIKRSEVSYSLDKRILYVLSICREGPLFNSSNIKDSFPKIKQILNPKKVVLMYLLYLKVFLKPIFHFYNFITFMNIH